MNKHRGNGHRNKLCQIWLKGKSTMRPPEITEPELRAFLLEYGDKPVGLAGSTCGCPIARLYKLKHEMDVSVSSTDVVDLATHTKRALPGFAANFIKALDDPRQAYTPVTGKEALVVLYSVMTA